MYIMKSLLFILLCFCFVDGSAQKKDGKKKVKDTERIEESYFDKNTIRYDNIVYKDYIKSVTLYRPGLAISSTILALNGQDKLVLGFDDLSGKMKDYNYTVFHCTSDWELTDMMETEYLSGFYDNYISDYEFSFNTLQKYIHYEFSFPNEDANITKSGNYVLYVFEDNDQEKPILTRRFNVTENGINILPNLKRASKIDDRDYRQEIDFNLVYGTVPIMNPYSNVKVYIQQNGRIDNMISGLKPIFVKDTELVYDFDEANVFDGNNEFRFFDFKSLNYQSINVQKYDKNDTTNLIYLKMDVKRTFKNYYSTNELNGKYVIDRENANDPDVDSDYGFVHFQLKYFEPIQGGDLYVFGAFSDWKFKEEFKMTFNEDKGIYEANIYLKQGYYNYQYVLLSDNKKVGDVSFIEGTHFETENDYTIYVYYTDPAQRYERLIGVKEFNSIKGR
ncbi:MAG: hypothetical protein ACI9J3_002749 [Parvicellaceae bacterium]|jgi:hypothetical protein